MGCNHLVELLIAEKVDLKDEISRHKYYMSQKESREVSFREAERDFIEYHLNLWATGYKRAYCSLVCKERDCPSSKYNKWGGGDEPR